MEKAVFVSLCLLGVPCRYDGTSCYVPELAEFLLKSSRPFVALCPEVEAGLSIPRPPAEIRDNNKVVTILGENVTSEVEKGAVKAVQTVQKYNICQAVLKAFSPCCGYGEIYDGNFSSSLVTGKGIFALALETIGVKISNEENWRELLDKIR